MAHPMTDTGRATPRGVSPRRALRWPTWLRVVVLAAVVVVAVVVTVAAARLLDRREFSSVTLGGPVDRIDLQVARGDVELVAGTSDDVVVQRTTSWRFRGPDLTASVDGSTARIHASCPRVPLPLSDCSVTHRVEVPPGVRVDVRADAGSVVADGLDGWLRIITSNGRVEATGLLTDEILVDTHGGSVTIDFGRPPSRVDVVSGGGDVDLTVPEAMYELRIAAGDGEVTTRVDSVDMAERMIRIDTSGGDVVVDPTGRLAR